MGQKKQDLAQRLLPQATLGASSSLARATAVDHFKPGILGWVLGDRSAKTFEPLWEIVKKWQCYFYVTRTRMRSSRLAAVCAYALRWKVYPGFIPDGDQIVCKTYMTRVEGENTRLKHYLGGAYAPDRLSDGTRRECVRIAP